MTAQRPLRLLQCPELHLPAPWHLMQTSRPCSFNCSAHPEGSRYEGPAVRAWSMSFDRVQACPELYA